METLKLIFDILNALGSLATVGAFVFLFRRDKDKQAQIDKLAGITESLDNQNETLRKQNELIAEQITVYRDFVFAKENDNQALNKLHEIEEKRLKLSVKPNLWLNGAGYRGGEGTLHIDLNNKGETAKLLEFNLIEGDITLQGLSQPYDLDKDAYRYIYGRTKGEKHIKDCEYKIEVVYSDRLDNKYILTIDGKGSHAKITKNIELT